MEAMKKTFHHGTLKSPRLKMALKYLTYKPHGLTTIQLGTLCGSTRPSSDVAELRANGIHIRTQYEGKTETGRRVYRYFLEEGV